MSSGFGWIDFSNEQRDRVFSVIDLLSTGGTVDELGIGSVRDAIADWLFPGVSTIQTRPKYFIILTDIFLTYQKQFHSGEKVANLSTYLKAEEHQIMHLLARNHEYKDGDGVIGVAFAQNKGELARKASSVYWNGLRVHKFIDTDFSSSEYLLRNNLSELKKSTNEEGDDDYTSLEDSFGIKTPFFSTKSETMKLDLTKEEATFLRDQFMDSTSELKQKNNLLSQLFKPERTKIIVDSNNFKEMALDLINDLSLHEETRKILTIAILFDFLIHGAHIRYNIQLHKKSSNLNFDSNWENWKDEVKDKKEELTHFDFDYLFNQIAPRTVLETQLFMKKWRDEIIKETINVEFVDQLVYNQEIKKKGAKAKLASVSGEFNSWVGIQSLQYRFNVVRNFVKDIQQHV